jgi:putative ABC transport system permease protein
LALDPNLPPFAIRSLDELVRGAIALPEFNLAVLGGFAMLALGLAALGVYGVLSYSVSTRTDEIGLRMALGARSGNIVKLVLREAAGLVALGLAIGWGAAIALTRFMTTLLYEVAPNDIATFGTISGVLLVTGFIAALLPARRAASLDPIKALRTE